MAPSRESTRTRREIELEFALAALPPQPAGVTKPFPRRGTRVAANAAANAVVKAAVKAAVKKTTTATTTRPATRAFTRQATALKNEVKSEEPAEPAPAPDHGSNLALPNPQPSQAVGADPSRAGGTTHPSPRRVMYKRAANRVTAIKNEESAEPALASVPAADASTSKLANITWQPAPAPAPAPAPPTPNASKGITIISPVQPSPIQSPPPAHSAEAELESLITLGRQHVESELRERIVEEKNRRHILARQKTAYARYQNYLRTLTDLEDELRELKEENRVDEEMVREQAEIFRRMMMRWARLFEEYAGQLGIRVWDLERLGNAW